MPVSSVFGARPLVKGGGAVSSEKSRALIVSVTVVTQRISLVAPDTSNHDKENVMPRLKQVFSLILAASTLVMSAHTEAAIIYDVTNATSVQNGYSLSGYIEVFGTGTLSNSSLLSFNVTATKEGNPTVTVVSGLPSSVSNVMGLIATDSALYVPDGSVLQISEGANAIDWINDLYGMNFYRASPDYGTTFAWNTGSYPITDGNSWQIGSVQAVPEPSTYCMALAGLACGGYTMFRRRKRA
jgi:phage gp45-like